MSVKETWYQRKINLDDGWVVSIICKDHVSYGCNDNLFECALLYPNGGVDDKSVTGFLDFHQVAQYIRKAKKKHNEVKI
jgi:hypothetical protein